MHRLNLIPSPMQPARSLDLHPQNSPALLRPYHEIVSLAVAPGQRDSKSHRPRLQQKRCLRNLAQPFRISPHRPPPMSPRPRQACFCSARVGIRRRQQPGQHQADLPAIQTLFHFRHPLLASRFSAVNSPAHRILPECRICILSQGHRVTLNKNLPVENLRPRRYGCRVPHPGRYPACLLRDRRVAHPSRVVCGGARPERAQ